MDAVAGRALAAIEADLTRKGGRALPRQFDPLCYDPSHCFPARASGTARSTLAPRGPSKPKRCDLRQCRRAVLGTRVGQRPLEADVSEGQTGAATRLPGSLTALRHRLEPLVGPLAALTLV